MMKIPMFTMPVEKMVTSKGMIAGFSLVFLGGYLIYNGSVEIGLGVIMNGFGYLGIRDAK